VNKPPAQTILRWLRDNGLKLGALTSHDTRALLAAAQIAELWISADYGNRPKCASAFRSVVEQMQESTRILAFHAIAHVGDWCHRWQLWKEAELPAVNGPECKFGPRRAEA
jgi:hypothetical protein